MSKSETDLLILGGGASGLSLGLLTGARVLEADSESGGHSRSTIEDGFTFDRGPHIMFSRSSLLLDCMISSLDNNVHQCTRNNKVLIRDRLVKCPIENDLYSLSDEDRLSSVLSFIQTRIAQSANPSIPNNLADWFTVNFGQALTDLYFRPYNEKVWKTRLEDLSMTWSERIPSPPIEDVIKSALGWKTEGYLHQLYYHYPQKGGYSALMESWAGRLKPDQLSLNEKILQVERDRDCVVVTTSRGVHTAQ